MFPNTIREFAASFQKSRILLTGFELDIFTNVEKTGKSAYPKDINERFESGLSQMIAQKI